MVKHLLLVRHAQAEQPSPAVKDLERDLTSSGVSEAIKMGTYIKQMQFSPDIILTSFARRTVATGQLLAEQLSFDLNKIRTDQTLYESSMRNLISVINQLEESCSQVVIVSHNPTLTYLAEYLTHEVIGSLPTCGAVCIRFNQLKWTEVAGNTGKLIWFEYPGKS